MKLTDWFFSERKSPPTEALPGGQPQPHGAGGCSPVSVPNVELPQLAASARHAAAVLDTVGPFVRRGMRLTVAVGNEPLAPWYGGAFRPHPRAGWAGRDEKNPTANCLRYGDMAVFTEVDGNHCD